MSLQQHLDVYANWLIGKAIWGVFIVLAIAVWNHRKADRTNQ